MNFKDFFESEDYILFDGATGTQIYAQGIPKGHCYDELNISMPEVVMNIHKEYFEAGARVITTNTFGANRYILEEYYDLGTKTREINYYGARIARRIAKINAFVAGSVGPVSRPLDKDKFIDKDQTKTIFSEQMEALVEGGVDLIVLESFACLDELLTAIEAAENLNKNLFIIAEMSFPNNGLTLYGRNPQEVASTLDTTPVQVIGSNCGTGPQCVYEAIKKMGSVSEKELSAMPNAGLAQFAQGRFLYPYNPEYFAKYGKKFLEAGVKIVGGCCGTTPDHIRWMDQILEGLKPRKRKPKSVTVITQKLEPKKEQIKSKLKSLFDENKIVTSVEIDPPKDSDFEQLLRSIEPFVQHIDVINISDSPMARPRMSPISAGKLLKDTLAKEIIVHYTCRDRNIVGIQSDLLGAAAFGLDNFLALGGDPPSIGDYPFATGVYDITSEGLVEMMSALNHSRDILGNPMGRQTQFYIGVGMTVAEGEKHLETARQKISRGAHFIVTQPVFDINSCRRILENLKESRIPVIVSILPLVSDRNAEYIHYEVPGITIPEIYLKRMETKRGKEGEKEGILIARELIQQLKPLCNGILMMPPFNKFHLLDEILT